MKVFITLEITRVDNDSVKGDEFDEVLQDAVEEAVSGIDVDGWEVGKISIERSKPEDKGIAQEVGESIKTCFSVKEVDGIGEDRVQLDEKSYLNEKYTWRELLLLWADDLLRKPRKK